MNTIKKLFIIFSIFTFFTNCKKETKTVKTESELKVIKQRQDSIINKHLKNGAWKHAVYSSQWQLEIDKGLAKDSTIAYLWQQKAMPLYKQGKYEIGKEYIDKAVKYDRQRWQDYRAFLKCIFAKTYREAIQDFEDYKRDYGYSYVMDHTYDFYIAVSYLQLNEYSKAEEIFKTDYERQFSEHGKSWLHPVDLFYYGISKYELGKYEEAIDLFDLALGIHNQFSDAQYYKSLSLFKIGKEAEAEELLKIAKVNGEQGFSFNEDNAIYERYPYQIRW